MAEQLVSNDPQWAGESASGLLGGPTARLVAAPAWKPGDPVTLGDLLDNPRDAIGRIGQNLTQDVTDPKTWLSVAAAYFGPKVMRMAGPTIAANLGAAREAASAPADALLGAAMKRFGADPDALALQTTRLRLQTARARTRIAEMKADMAPAGQAAAATSPAAATPAPSSPAAPSAAPPSAVPSAPAPMLKAMAALKQAGYSDAEVAQAAQWLQQGVSSQDVVNRLAATRQLQAGSRPFAKLPTDLEAAKAVASRNQTGKW